MESNLYAYLRCRKDVKFTSSLTRHVNTCKILITMPSHQLSKPIAILEDNTTNCLDLPSDNNKEGGGLGASNHSKKRIRLANNNNEDIKPANID